MAVRSLPDRVAAHSPTPGGRRIGASRPVRAGAPGNAFTGAVAQFPDADDLARFLGGYTAVMNVVSIAFLVLLAGPLMRRYGLRLGVSANPVVLLVMSVVMLVVLAVAGGASIALLVAVSAARILDIALTDGTTRTSINAMYQVLRLPAQATIEGTGVPVAISASGLLVLALNALPSPLITILVTTVLVCAAWVWTGVLLHRSYGPALVDVLRERRVLHLPVVLGEAAEDQHTAERLLESPDPRAARLGLELVSALATPELAHLADDPRPGVRLTALHAMTASGDAGARADLVDAVHSAECSPDPDLRAMAALALTVLDDVDRRDSVGRLMADPSAAVRTAALDAVHLDDDALVPAVVSALDDPATTVAACDAAGRLGDAMLPASEEALVQAAAADADSRQTLRAVRLVRALTTRTVARDAVLARWMRHPDPGVGRVVLERLAAPGPAPAALVMAVNEIVAADLAHAVRVLGAVVALRSEPGTVPERPVGERASADGARPLQAAVADELTLLRNRLLAAVLVRYGTDQLAPATAKVMDGSGPAPLALEALEVVLGATAAARLIPVLDSRIPPEGRLRHLVVRTGSATPARGVTAVLADLVEDREDAWRSRWVRACAVRAACDRGIADELDLVPVRALGDPMVNEELDRVR